MRTYFITLDNKVSKVKVPGSVRVRAASMKEAKRKFEDLPMGPTTTKIELKADPQVAAAQKRTIRIHYKHSAMSCAFAKALDWDVDL